MSKKKIDIPSCNICGLQVDNIAISKDSYNIYQCKSCGLAFTHPQPQFLEEQYNSSYFDLYRRRREFRLKRADQRLKYIELVKEPGRLLDVGCSLGYFVEAANSRGWKASGVEISPYAAKEAADMGLDIRAGLLEEAEYPDNLFDCVTMWDVLEHVPDPTRHMLEVRRILAKDGLVVIGTPNLAHMSFRVHKENWRHLKPAEHIFYFQKSSISRLLEKTGFDIITSSVAGGRVFPGSRAAAIRSAISEFIKLNDVMTIYGVKNGL